MVKVLRCHHFKAQTVVPCREEPVAMFATRDRLFVATTSRTVEVYDLTKPDFPKVHWFNTEALVTCILHNAYGNYVATIETKKSILAEYQFVKVYINWQVDPDKQPMKVRIAGKIFGINSKDLKANKAEVIDIPVSGKVIAITSCQMTSHLLVAMETKIYLYRVVTKQLSNSDQVYQDLELYVQFIMDSTVCSMALCGQYLSCLTSQNAQLIHFTFSEQKPDDKLQIPNEKLSEENCSVESESESSTWTKQQVKETENSMRTDEDDEQVVQRDRRTSANFSPSKNQQFIGLDSSFVEWDFTEGITQKPSTRPKHPGKHKHQPKTIFLKGFHAPIGGVSPFSVPIQGKPVYPEIIIHKEDEEQAADVSILIQVKQRNRDPFKAVQLIPTYDFEKSKLMADGSLPLGGLSCFLEAAYSGVMYSVLPVPCLLSQYKFASEAFKVVCQSSLLHGVTSDGVETYTARCHISADHNMETFDNLTKTCPAADLETCLISIQPFIGISQVTTSPHHLFLFNKVEATKDAGKSQKNNLTSWSLYALEISSGVDLYKDMVMLGSKHQESSPPTYLHLLLEGFICLKSQLLEDRHGDVKTQDLLSECSALLGDFYAQPGCEEWKLASPYYIMSGLTVEDILRQAELHKQIVKTALDSYGQGLMCYLHYMAFIDTKQDTIKPSCCDSLLNCFAKSDPHNLSKVILFGKYQNYDAGKALSLLEGCIKENGDQTSQCLDLLCVAVLSLRLCEPDRALSAVKFISELELINICVEYPGLFHVDFTELSPLAQLMRQHLSSVFLKILVAFYDQGVILLDTAFSLLTKNVYQSEIHKNTHVRGYLEAILNDKKREDIFEEAASILCDIYLQRLIEWNPPIMREISLVQYTMPKGSGYFGSRHAWLDYLPPFNNPKNLRQACQYLQLPRHSAGIRSKVTSSDKLDRDVHCSCYSCNEDLLKIQSLLCSSFVSEKLVRLVLVRIQGSESTCFYESLWLLAMTCIDFHQSADVVVVKYPNILPEFFTSFVKEDKEKVRYTMGSLMSTLKKLTDSPSSNDIVYVQTVKGVLSELASQLTMVEFLSILPNNGSLLSLIPYIRKCCQADNLRRLKTEITAKGEELSTAAKS